MTQAQNITDRLWCLRIDDAAAPLDFCQPGLEPGAAIHPEQSRWRGRAGALDWLGLLAPGASPAGPLECPVSRLR